MLITRQAISWIYVDPVHGVKKSVCRRTCLILFTFAAIHYDDVIMTMLASHITSLTVVYSIVYSGVNIRKHQSSASLAFVLEIHRGPVNFPHKWPVTRKMFPFDDVIMHAWFYMRQLVKRGNLPETKNIVGLLVRYFWRVMTGLSQSYWWSHEHACTSGLLGKNIITSHKHKIRCGGKRSFFDT